MTDGQASANRRAAALTAGRYDVLVEEYDYPLTLYVHGQPQRLATREAAWEFFQSFHSALVAAGLPQLTARVVAIDLPRAARRRMWTEWSASGHGKAAVVVASTICYARETAGGMLTEILEFTSLDLPMVAAA